VLLEAKQPIFGT